MHLKKELLHLNQELLHALLPSVSHETGLARFCASQQQLLHNYCGTIAELLRNYCGTIGSHFQTGSQSPGTFESGYSPPRGSLSSRASKGPNFRCRRLFLAAVLASNNALGTPGSEFSLAYGSSLESLSTRFRCLLSFFSSNMLPAWSRQLSDVVYVSAHALSPPPHCRWFRR